MLIKTGTKKILICTSSNKIIDDLTHRVLQLEDLGLKYGEIIRVCASNYTATDKIKKHTLDQIVNRFMSVSLFEEAEDKLEITNTIKEMGLKNAI